MAEALHCSHATVRKWLSICGLPPNYPKAPKLDFVEGGVRCSKCKDIHPAKEYQYKRQRLSYCKSCSRKAMRKYRANLCSDIGKYLHDRWSRMKARTVSYYAKGRVKEPIAFTITEEDLLEQFHLQKGMCFYTDEMMVWGDGHGKNPRTMSMDKIIPKDGYIRGNVVFCTMKANLVKQNLTTEEIAMWLPGWYKRIKNFWRENNATHA